MLSDQEKQTLAWFEALRSEAEQRGAISKLCSHGVLVLCLPRYGTAEQLLLETPLTSSQDRPQGRRGRKRRGESPDPGAGQGSGQGALGQVES